MIHHIPVHTDRVATSHSKSKLFKLLIHLINIDGEFSLVIHRFSKHRVILVLLGTTNEIYK
jgi:hypothetical protein